MTTHDPLTLTAEIHALALTLNGDDFGDWIEWCVDGVTVCYVPGDCDDLGVAIAASLGSEEIEDIRSARAFARDSIGAILIRLFRRGKRESGSEWTSEKWGAR